jgi:hypothetical protein
VDLIEVEARRTDGERRERGSCCLLVRCQMQMSRGRANARSGSGALRASRAPRAGAMQTVEGCAGARAATAQHAWSQSGRKNPSERGGRLCPDLHAEREQHDRKAHVRCVLCVSRGSWGFLFLGSWVVWFVPRPASSRRMGDSVYDEVEIEDMDFDKVCRTRCCPGRSDFARARCPPSVCGTPVPQEM